MKWTVWIDPNQTIEEEYPDGFSRDDVFKAASNRYANRVTTVSPAPIGASETSNSSSSSSNNSGSDISLSGVLALIVFFGGAWVLVNYWPYVITIGVICLIIWIIKVFNDD